MFLLAVWAFLLSSTVLAQGVVVPTGEQLVVLQGSGLSPTSQVSFKGGDGLQLAVHPTSPTLATLVEGRLEFWNLPSLSLASKFNDPLLEGAVDCEFSPTGGELFVLSAKLKAVVVFDLARSKVSGLIGLPGGQPQAMQVSTAGLLVRLENSVVLVSTDPKVGLVAQFRYPETLAGGALSDGRLFVARRGILGVDAWDVKSGKLVGRMPSSLEARSIAPRPGQQGVFLLSSSGVVESWGFGQSSPQWSSAGRYEGISLSPDGSSLYALDRAGQKVVSLDTATGAPVVSAPVPSSTGLPLAF